MIEVTVEKMTLGGAGLARLQEGPDAGLVLFIPFSAPGDVLKVKITEKKKNFAFAEIVEIISSSPLRAEPPCPVFGECGGCNWQHLQYKEQLKQKQSIVEEQLARVIDSSTKIFPILSSPQELHYRNRIQVHFNQGKWGYFARKSHRLVPVDDCLIAERALISAIKSVDKNHTKRVQVALQNDLAVKFESPEADDEDSSGFGFSQVNRFQNEKLIEAVLSWSEGDPPWTEIWDLYSGAGNFSFPLFHKHKRASISAVELSTKSVKIAQAEVRMHNISPKRLQFYASDVSTFLKRARLGKDGLILVDPPRNGCEAEAVERLASQSFKKLLYISCNPATLARDLTLLKAKGPRGLRISRIQAFDMFPQTDHVEVLAEVMVDDIPS